MLARRTVGAAKAAVSPKGESGGRGKQQEKDDGRETAPVVFKKEDDKSLKQQVKEAKPEAAERNGSVEGGEARRPHKPQEVGFWSGVEVAAFKTCSAGTAIGKCCCEVPREGGSVRRYNPVTCFCCFGFQFGCTLSASWDHDLDTLGVLHLPGVS